jgi:DNA (cytosine-5)-methyltransferase 1
LKQSYKYIDLFAGIGGFRLALDSLGGNCVFSSEIDPKSQNVYLENFGDRPAGDITKIPAASIPKHDVLCGGFPCQSFSMSEKKKGFQDTRGTLFFDIARIVAHHEPKIVFLENVKHLIKHDNGRTIAKIEQVLEDLGYSVHFNRDTPKKLWIKA